MSSMVPDGNEEQIFQKMMKYAIKNIQYVQCKQKIPKINQKNPNLYFINITNEAMQFRRIPRVNITQLISEEELSQEEIMKNSHLEDSIEFEEIIKFEKKILQIAQGSHYIIGVYDNRKDSVDKNKISVGFRLTTEDNMNQFFQQANKKLKEQKDYLKKSATNFIGIEQNIRKIVDRILVSSYPKREVYNRIMDKMGQKGIKLNSAQNKMIVYALIGNHPDMQNFLRKEKIEAYDIQKRRYEDFLKEESLTNMAEIIQPGKEHVVEGYSEKRKLDGVIIKKQKQSKEVDNAKIQQQLFLGKIPLRSQCEIDEIIGLQKQVQNMQVEEKPSIDLHLSYRAEKIKIPVKDYGIVNKQIERVQKQPIGPGQIFDKNTQVPIQAVKFMYQLMKANSKHRVLNSIIEGPIDKVLECLRDVLVQCQKRQDEKTERRMQNKSIIQLLQKATKNYMSYRRNPNKFY